MRQRGLDRETEMSKTEAGMALAMYWPREWNVAASIAHDYRLYRSRGLAASLALTVAKNNAGERGKN